MLVLCAKGLSGIIKAQVTALVAPRPMRRVGPGAIRRAFEEISWDEALGIATQPAGPARHRAREIRPSSRGVEFQFGKP